MSLLEATREIFEALSVDFYAGWSFMDLIQVSLLLTALVAIVNYFFFKADSK